MGGRALRSVKLSLMQATVLMALGASPLMSPNGIYVLVLSTCYIMPHIPGIILYVLIPLRIHLVDWVSQSLEDEGTVRDWPDVHVSSCCGCQHVHKYMYQHHLSRTSIM